MKNFRGENMEDSIRYSWTQFYELNGTIKYFV